jgi:hypothetical protein
MRDLSTDQFMYPLRALYINLFMSNQFTINQFMKMKQSQRFKPINPFMMLQFTTKARSHLFR